jgi:hypothetical protein
VALAKPICGVPRQALHPELDLVRRLQDDAHRWRRNLEDRQPSGGGAFEGYIDYPALATTPAWTFAGG